MRQLALIGLVASLLLGGVTVLETSESVSSRRDKQDRLLQAAVSNEVALISGNQRQTATALSLMFVNPAVAQLLSGREVPSRARAIDVADTAASLAAIQRSSLASLSAACLDNDRGRQLACAPNARAAVFPLVLGRQFAAIANSSAGGGGSRAFVSPVTGKPSVAFVAPIRAGARTLGFVHLDMATLTARGSDLLVEGGTPSVHIQLGSYAGGRISLGAPAVGLHAGAPTRTLSVGGAPLGEHPQSTLDAGRRAMVAVLPMAVGGTHDGLAVLASESRPNPDFLNAWSTELLTVLATAILAPALLDRRPGGVQPPGHPRADHRRAHRPAQPPRTARGPAPYLPARERGAARVRVVLRPQRLQELQRLLRPPCRRQPAVAPGRAPARGGRTPRHRLPARRRRVLRADHRPRRRPARAVPAGARGAGRTGRRLHRHVRRRRRRDPAARRASRCTRCGSPTSTCTARRRPATAAPRS